MQDAGVGIEPVDFAGGEVGGEFLTDLVLSESTQRETRVILKLKEAGGCGPCGPLTGPFGFECDLFPGRRSTPRPRNSRSGDRSTR